MDTGEIIKGIRTKHGLTQNEFAERLSISRSALTQLEAGNTKPSFDVVRILAEDFDMNPSRFFPGKTSAKGTRKEIAASQIEAVLEFYRKHYGIMYNEIMESRMIEFFLKIESDNQKDPVLGDVYNIYKKVRRITEKLERDFIDPLKRHLHTMKTLKKLKEEGIVEELNKEATETRENLNMNLQIIFRDAWLFMNMYGNKLSELPDVLTEPQIELLEHNNEHQKIIKYSQEKYLNAFLYLLKNVKNLEQVEEYFDSETFWRE